MEQEKDHYQEIEELGRRKRFVAINSENMMYEVLYDIMKYSAEMFCALSFEEKIALAGLLVQVESKNNLEAVGSAIDYLTDELKDNMNECTAKVNKTIMQHANTVY